MTAQLVKIKAASPEAIICWTIGKAGAIVAKNVKQLGIQAPLFQCHGLPDPIYVQLAGEASEGNIMPSTKLMVASQLPNSDPQKKVITGVYPPLQQMCITMTVSFPSIPIPGTHGMQSTLWPMP